MLKFSQLTAMRFRRGKSHRICNSEYTRVTIFRPLDPDAKIISDTHLITKKCINDASVWHQSSTCAGGEYIADTLVKIAVTEDCTLKIVTNKSYETIPMN